MELKGRRIHIAGSADVEVDPSKLKYVHAIIGQLTLALGKEGANFLLPFGKEPFLKNRNAGPSIIFYWTIAENVHQMLVEGSAMPSSPNGRLISTLATAKTDASIPVHRRQLYEQLRDKRAISMEILDHGWTAGVLQRQRQAQLADILIGISGGQGVEHLAIEYSSRGKPVVPLDIHVGSSGRDGTGASGLFKSALSTPGDFFRVTDGESAAELLDRTRTRNGQTEVGDVVSSLMYLLHKLAPPRAFYVRLLNSSLPEYASVEGFFRQTVDKLVVELGYEALQMGIGKNDFAWMNQAIFDSLHHSAVTVVDLTGLRPNCFMELGYALGNKQRIIVTAREDTRISFDAFALEAFQWKDAEDPVQQLNRFRTHWERNINMPKLVQPKEAK
jgi:hypothetical protein